MGKSTGGKNECGDRGFAEELKHESSRSQNLGLHQNKFGFTSEEAPPLSRDLLTFHQIRLLAERSARTTDTRAEIPRGHGRDSIRSGLHVVEVGLVCLRRRQLGIQEIVLQVAEPV